MNLLHNLTTIDKYTNGSNKETVRVVVEIPKGTRAKYEYDPRGFFTVVRMLHRRYPYPYNYGCIPQAMGGDGDFLDAIIFTEEPLERGTILNCKIIGAVKVIDNGEVDDKLLCVPYYVEKGKIKLKKYLKYLNNYKYPYQEGTIIEGVVGEEAAMEILREAQRRYKNV